MHHAVYAFDIRYLRPFVVSARSLIAHWRSEKRLCVHAIWCECEDDEFIEETVSTLDAGNGEGRVKLETHRVSLHDIPHVRTSEYISAATQLRLFLPQILPASDVVLYLDSDTLVVADLSPVFLLRVDTICACDNASGMMDASRWNCGYAFPPGEESFNAGVMLLSLVGLRRGGFATFRDELLEKDAVNDQSLLNLYLQGRHGALPPEYNTLPEDYDSARTRVIHWCTRRKPWSLPSPGVPDAKWRNWDLRAREFET